MATVNNLKDLERVLKAKIKDALEKEVVEEVKDSMVAAIDREVYNVYEPKQYERQKEKGGLTDRGNMLVKPVEDGISVRNVRFDVDIRTGEVRDVASVVEHGGPYMYSWEGMRPRPFMAATREDLKVSGSHVKALKKGLKRQGLNVK